MVLGGPGINRAFERVLSLETGLSSMIFYDVYRRLHQLLLEFCVKRPDQVVTPNQCDAYTGSMRRVGLIQTYAIALGGVHNSMVALHIFGPQCRPHSTKNIGTLYVAPGSRALGFTGATGIATAGSNNGSNGYPNDQSRDCSRPESEHAR